MTFEQLRYEIAQRLDDGYDLAAVEMETIEPVRCLSEDQRAALWLFAWSYQQRPGEGKSQSEIVPLAPPAMRRRAGLDTHKARVRSLRER
jgi:hypothetical protein